MKTINETINREINLLSLIPNNVLSQHYKPRTFNRLVFSTMGMKPISPYVEYSYSGVGYMTESETRELMEDLYDEYKIEWNQKLKVLDLTYKIEDNYNMIEQEEVDNDVIEKNIRNLLNSSAAQSEEFRELVDKLIKADDDEIAKTGKDVVQGDLNSSLTGTVQDQTTTNDLKVGEDTLSFRNRKDVERGNSNKGIDSRELENATGQDVLSFQGRKDTQSAQETSTQNETGSSTDNTESTQANDTKSGMYGINSTIGVPSPVTDVDVDGSSTETHTGSSNVNRTGETSGNSSLSKTGSETTSSSALNDKTITGAENEQRNNEVERQGSELHTTRDQTEGSSTHNQTSGSTQTDVQNQETLYGSKDTRKANSTVDTNTNENKTNNSTQTDTTQDTSNGERTERVVRILTRSGNIGVTTVTKMIQEQLDTWSTSILDQIIENMSDRFTLPIYQGGNPHGNVFW